MTHTFLAYIATLCYLAASAFIGMRLLRKEGWIPERRLALAVGFAGLLLHSWLLWDSIFSSAGINLGFYHALALTAWTIVALLLVSSLNKPVDNLGLILLPAAALEPDPGDPFGRGRLHAALGELAAQDSCAALDARLQPADPRRRAGDVCWRFRIVICATATPAASSAPCRRSRPWRACCSR